MAAPPDPGAGPTSVQVELGPEGCPVVAKRATEPAARARLRREAEVLRAVEDPHLVRLVRHTESATGSELLLGWAGAHTLDTAASLGVGAVGEVVSGVAEALAALHAEGHAHGRVEPAHVVLGPDGPVLCGLGGATRERGAAAADVADLGRLLAALLVDRVDLGEPIPDQRRWGTPRWVGYQRAALLNLADHAMADDPAGRPTARAFAESVRAAVAPAVPARPAIRLEVPPVSRAHQVRGLGAALAVVASSWLVLSGLLGVRGGPDQVARTGATTTVAATPRPVRATAAAGTRPAGTPTTTTTAPPPVAPPTTVPARTCRPARAPKADVDGDGCPEQLHIEGGTVTAGDRVFRMGGARDSITVGDFDCDGRSAPALLRRSTGEVFVFDGWSTPDRDSVATAVALLPGSTRLTTSSEGGCTGLVAVDGAGRRVTVAVGSTR